MGSATSTIGIHFDDTPPFVAAKKITGTITLNNKLNKYVKCKRIYAELIGEVVYTTEKGHSRVPQSITHRLSVIQQLITLEESEEEFTLANDYYSWPMNFSLPTFLPPSLDPVWGCGPYIHYKIRVIFERSEYAWNQICLRQDFPILVIASPSSYLYRSDLPVETENNNDNGVTARATLVEQKTSFAPGEDVLLNIELHNLNDERIIGLSIDLVQHRNIKTAKNELIIRLLDLCHLQEFSGKNYRETLQLKIPNGNRIIPSFNYTGPEFSENPMSVDYTLTVQVKFYDFFYDFTLNLPIQVHSKEMYMPRSNEDEAPPPPYEVAIATH